MKVLVLGGTRLFGVHLVRELLAAGHDVTIATRGRTPDPFGAAVERVRVDRTDPAAMRDAFAHRSFDAVCDDLAYCSNDVKTALEALRCDRYIMVSSTAVYPLHPNTREEDFVPQTHPLIWGARANFSYDEGKRQAERALFGEYPAQQTAAVRLPFVIGPDDYTRRLRFYVERTVRQVPIWVDDPAAQMSFVSSAEAGRFLSWLAAESPLTGPVNGCCSGTVSMGEVLEYVGARAGTPVLLAADGEPAPYNGTPAHSINTRRAEAAGFAFRPLQSWLPALLDLYIREAVEAGPGIPPP